MDVENCVSDLHVSPDIEATMGMSKLGNVSSNSFLQIIEAECAKLSDLFDMRTSMKAESAKLFDLFDFFDFEATMVVEARLESRTW